MPRGPFKKWPWALEQPLPFHRGHAATHSLCIFRFPKSQLCRMLNGFSASVGGEREIEREKQVLSSCHWRTQLPNKPAPSGLYANAPVPNVFFSAASLRSLSRLGWPNIRPSEDADVPAPTPRKASGKLISGKLSLPFSVAWRQAPEMVARAFQSQKMSRPLSGFLPPPLPIVCDWERDLHNASVRSDVVCLLGASFSP